jgi:cyclopropane fatty-acyl-phospholipid synthase-like methyltransferase
MPADFDIYRQDMANYYDQASRLAYLFDPTELARQYDAVYATEGSWLRDLALAIQRITRGRRVLEIAAGHGRWTRYIAESAAHVLATDASEGMLDQARQVVRQGRQLRAGRCKFLPIDAFHIDEAPGRFDCAVAVNFFQHIPTARQQDFLAALHRKLGPGGEVLIAINRLRRSTRMRFYRKPGEPDLFDLRQLKDGSVYEIIDNVFTPGQLAAIFDGRATNYRFHAGAKFYWITYSIP